MARPLFQDISAPAPLQVVASPVNTYVRPADPAPSPLHGIAEGLAEFDAGLQTYLDKQKEQQKEADALKAENDFNSNNSQGWAEAVRTGKVPAQYSPQYEKSYKAAQGNLAGVQMRMKFNKEYMSWAGRYENDPKAFQQFLHDFVQKHSQTDDVGILRGLEPHIRQLYSDATGAYETDSNDALKKKAMQTEGALVNSMIDGAANQGLTSGGTDYEKLWADIQARRAEAIKPGNDPAELDKQLVGAITTQAVARGDEKMLSMLDQKIPGTNTKYRDVPEYKNALDDARVKIASVRISQENLAYTKQERADKTAKEEAQAAFYKQIGADPANNFPDEAAITAVEKVWPSVRKDLAETRKTLLDANGLEDPEHLLQINRDIANGTMTIEDLNKFVQNGVIKTPQTWNSMTDRLEAYQKAHRDGTGLLRDPTSNVFREQLRQRTQDNGVLSSLSGQTSWSNEGLQAEQDFDTELMQWEAAHPNEVNDPQARFKAIQDIGQKYLDRIDPKAAFDAPGKYTSNQEIISSTEQNLADQQDRRSRILPQQTPQGDQQGQLPAQNDQQGTPDASQPADAGQPADGSETQKYFGGDTVPQLGDLPLDMQKSFTETLKAINEQAVKDGRPEMTWQELMDSIHRMTHEQMNKQGLLKKSSLDSTAGMDFGQAAGQLIETAYAPQGDAALSNASAAFRAVDPGSFEDPMTSPKLDPKVVSKFSGRHVPVAIRNNNPAAISFSGNEEDSFAARQPGYVGKTLRPANEGGYYAKFATPEAGIAAASKLLENYGEREVNTADAIVRRWSTGKNAWGAYSRTLQKFLNRAGYAVSGDTPLDLSNPEVRLAILMAKSAHESGAGRPVYQLEVFRRALDGDLGLSTQQET